VCALGCSGVISTDRMPIRFVYTSVHKGEYRKGGVRLGEPSCDDAYMRAVSGVPDAEELMRSCHRYHRAFFVAEMAVLAIPLTAIIADTSDGDRLNLNTAVEVTGGLTLVAFVIGMLMLSDSNDQLDRAVHVYNQAIGAAK
jgi:hypothetical protein